ncbi:MAG: alpha/beta hydrolase [Actinomycetota bacterium]
MTSDPDSPEWVYDELSYLAENAADAGVDPATVMAVRRVATSLPDGRTVSGLRWGETPPELVVVHGGAQNAHTWDTTLVALGRPALAVDLPGHGHSSWRDDRGYDPRDLADDVAVAVAEHAPEARVVCGMSLGGLTSAMLARRHAELVRRLVVIDITPGVTRDKAREVHDFVAGPQSFPSFTEIFERTVEFNPTRSASSLRRGILHNARRLDDGSWVWRYDRRGPAEGGPGAELIEPSDVRPDLWDDLGSTTQPLLFVRGGRSPVVDDDDVAELRRRRPDVRVVVVDDAGHSVQGDQPLVVARLLGGELADG